MISRLLARLGNTPKREATADERLALAALLVRIARADGVYEPAEKREIDGILSRRYGLSREEAAALRGRAEALEAEATDTVRFTRLIKEKVPHEERIAIVEAMWKISLADGEKDAEEAGLMRLVANLLGINDRDSALARQRVASCKKAHG